MVLPGGFIEFPVVHTYAPPCHCSCRSQLILFISHHYHSACLGKHYTGLSHLWSDIGYMIPAFNHLITYFLSTSFIKGFSFHLCYALDLYPSSVYILCIHKVGLIPWISDICHPKVAFLLFRINNRTSTCSSYNIVDKITGKVLFHQKIHT